MWLHVVYEEGAYNARNGWMQDTWKYVKGSQWKTLTYLMEVSFIAALEV
jgi:hypothetical protein